MKVDYDDLLTNYHEKIEIIEKQDIEIWELNKEIERLNNIINKLEKGIEDMLVDNAGEDTWGYEEELCLDRKEFLDKIKELKGSDKE